MKDKMKQNMTQNMAVTKYLEAMEKEASDGPGTKGIHGVKEKSFGRGIELADPVK